MLDPKTMLVLEENTRKHVADESFMMGTFILYSGVVLLGAGKIFMRPNLLLHLYSYQDQGGFLYSNQEHDIHILLPAKDFHGISRGRSVQR